MLNLLLNICIILFLLTRVAKIKQIIEKEEQGIILFVHQKS